jgi:hypothetical protein
MLVLDSIEFDLRGALDDMVGLLAPRAHEKGLELATEIAPDVPARVIGDPGRMRQVIVNLVSNAIKFTEKGEVVIRVEADGRVEGKDVVRFTVADTGIGIPLDKQATIFESFTQADSSMTRRFGGTGLGLTIASQLTQLMGGHIGVDSQPGSVASSTWPSRSRWPWRPAPPSPKVAPLELAGIRVLVVDDNRNEPSDPRSDAAGLGHGCGDGRRGSSRARGPGGCSSREPAVRPGTAGLPDAGHGRIRSGGPDQGAAGAGGHDDHDALLRRPAR